MNYTKKDISNIIELFISSCKSSNELALNQILNFSQKEFAFALSLLEDIKIKSMFDKYNQTKFYKNSIKEMRNNKTITKNISKDLRNKWLEYEKRFTFMCNKKNELEKLVLNIL